MNNSNIGSIVPINHYFLNKCAEITEAYDKLQGGWSLDSQLFHIVKEVSEFADIMRNKNNKYGEPLSDEWYGYFYDELADMHLTLFSTDNFLNSLEYDGKKIDVSNDKLNEAILKKLGIVEGRVIEAQTNRSLSMTNNSHEGFMIRTSRPNTVEDCDQYFLTYSKKDGFCCSFHDNQFVYLQSDVWHLLNPVKFRKDFGFTIEEFENEMKTMRDRVESGKTVIYPFSWYTKTTERDRHKRQKESKN